MAVGQDYVCCTRYKVCWNIHFSSSCSRLKAPRAPDATLFSKVIGDAFAVAIVGYAINISLGKTFALKHGYKVDSNQVRYWHTHISLWIYKGTLTKTLWYSQTAVRGILRVPVPVWLTVNREESNFALILDFSLCSFAVGHDTCHISGKIIQVVLYRAAPNSRATNNSTDLFFL